MFDEACIAPDGDFAATAEQGLHARWVQVLTAQQGLSLS